MVNRGVAVLGVEGTAHTIAVGVVAAAYVAGLYGVAIAALGMVFRLAEGALGAALDLTGITLSRPTLVDATLFAIGSTFFCWLLLRGSMMPRALAWTGVVASVILVVGLPLQLGGLLEAPLTMLMWMPMLAFELALAYGALVSSLAWILVRTEFVTAHALVQLVIGGAVLAAGYLLILGIKPLRRGLQ